MTWILILAAIGLWTCARAIARLVRLMFGDRTGNSGRFGHFESGE